MRDRICAESVAMRMQVRISPVQRQRLERVARLNLTNITGVIREAVDSYCADCGADPVFREGRSAPAKPDDRLTSR